MTRMSMITTDPAARPAIHTRNVQTYRPQHIEHVTRERFVAVDAIF